MNDKERDRIKCAIRHIQTAADVDPWAMEIAVEAMQRQIDQQNQRSFSCGQENDLISRQAAKHALCKAVHKNEDIPCENQTASCLWSKTRVCDYAREIDDLPSAQPERKKGEWKIYIISMLDGEGCKCSECGFEGASYWDYCPNCGARMDGEADE